MEINTFSFALEPVLRIAPGDRVITKTIDVRGFLGEKKATDFTDYTDRRSLWAALRKTL